ncbi:hypothetical protein R6Q59_018545 [Mikania micrantha]
MRVNNEIHHFAKLTLTTSVKSRIRIEEVTDDQLRMQNEAKKSCSRLLLDWDWEQSVNKIGQRDNVNEIGQSGSSVREIGHSANVNEIGQSGSSVREIGQSANVNDIGQSGDSVREIGQSANVNDIGQRGSVREIGQSGVKSMKLIHRDDLGLNGGERR